MSKLMSPELEKKLLENPYLSHDEEGLDAPIVVKFFNPTGSGTWLITEGDRLSDGDWMLFGYCHITNWEWGSVLLSEMEDIKLPYGMSIEIDRSAKGTVRENI